MLKPELQSKFLQHINNRKNTAEEGFTLIELLVVIIIIGILAAIALPAMINQVAKGRQAEAQQNIGAIDRAQQAYYMESASVFTTNLGDLALGIQTQTINYIYSIVINSDAGNTLSSGVTNFGLAAIPDLKSYAGITYATLQSTFTSNGPLSQSVNLSVLCSGTVPGLGTDAVIQGGTNSGDCSGPKTQNNNSFVPVD